MGPAIGTLDSRLRDFDSRYPCLTFIQDLYHSTTVFSVKMILTGIYFVLSKLRGVPLSSILLTHGDISWSGPLYPWGDSSLHAPALLISQRRLFGFPWGGFFSGLRPKEVPYFSCLRGGPMTLAFHGSKSFIFTILEADCTPLCSVTLIFLSPQVGSIHNLIALLFIFFSLDCYPSKCFTFLTKCVTLLVKCVL